MCKNAISRSFSFLNSGRVSLNQPLMSLTFGFTFGIVSRLMGRKAILKTGIWVETKAVNHYSELLETIEWDEDTRKIIEKDQADEYGHINRWKKMLESGVS